MDWMAVVGSILGRDWVLVVVVDLVMVVSVVVPEP
jgi:hypothetical protein